jgi:3-oxoacyl-[acyl-carrier protein] reductase
MNKVVIVTGASSGIGRAIAERFAMEGASLVLAGRTLTKLVGVVHEIEARRGRAHAVVCDVTKEEDVINLVAEAVRRYGSLDIMVNNAGVFYARDIVNTTLAEYENILDTNLKGAYLGCREAFKVMKEHGGGTILNMASVAGKEAWAGLGLYSASKFGLLGLTHALADEGTTYGIKVSAICPGAVNTPFAKGMSIPTEAMIQPEDIAEAALYLVTLPKNVVVKDLIMDRRGAE